MADIKITGKNAEAVAKKLALDISIKYKIKLVGSGCGINTINIPKRQTILQKIFRQYFKMEQVVEWQVVNLH